MYQMDNQGLTESIEELDVLPILESLGFDGIKDSAGEYICKCIFHDDEHHSFSINKKTKLWYCFTEGVGGNLVHLVMKSASLNFDDSIRYLFGDVKITPTAMSKSMFTGVFKKSDDEERAEVGLLETELNLYLDETPEYFFNRGFDSDVWKYFSCKYAPYGNFHNRIVVPVFDVDSRLVGLTGRAILEGIRPKWWHSPNFHKKEYLFNINVAIKYDVVLVAEGPFDVFRLHQAGYPNSVAIFGAEMSDEQASILLDNFKTVILVFDADDAGRKCLKSSIPKLSGQVNLYYTRMPDGEDPGELGFSSLVDRIKNFTYPAIIFQFEVGDESAEEEWAAGG